MKNQGIKKRIAVEGAVAAGILAVLGGVVFYLTTMVQSYTQHNAELESQMVSVTTEMTTLKDKFDKVKNNSSLYEEVMRKNSNDELAVNRQSVRAKFDELKSKYFLNNIRLSMGAVQEVPGPKNKTTNNAIVASEVTVSFEAITDEDVYGVLRSIQENFSGITRVNQFSIRRNEKVTEAALRAIANNGQYPLVQANMQFTWLGVKPIDTAITGDRAAPTPRGRRR